MSVLWRVESRLVLHTVGMHAEAFDPVPGTVKNSFVTEKSGPMLDQFKAGRGRVVAGLDGELEGEADAQPGSG